MVKLQTKELNYLSHIDLKFKKEDRPRFIKNPMNFMSFSLKELSFINMVLVVYTDQQAYMYHVYSTTLIRVHVNI